MWGHLALQCMMVMEDRNETVIKKWHAGCLTGKDSEQEEEKPHKISLCLSALLCTSFSFQSADKADKDWETVTKMYHSIFARRFLSGSSLQQSVCACRICVFCASGEKLHSVSLLAYANANGECGSWGSAPPSSSSERKFCGESEGAAEANFNFFLKGRWGIPVLVEMPGCVFPDEKHTEAHVAIGVSDWWEANTTSPWHLGWLVRLALSGKVQGKKWEGGGELLPGGSKALSRILSFEGVCASVRADTWM